MHNDEACNYFLQVIMKNTRIHADTCRGFWTQTGNATYCNIY